MGYRRSALYRLSKRAGSSATRGVVNRRCKGDRTAVRNDTQFPASGGGDTADQQNAKKKDRSSAARSLKDWSEPHCHRPQPHLSVVCNLFRCCCETRLGSRVFGVRLRVWISKSRPSHRMPLLARPWCVPCDSES